MYEPQELVFQPDLWVVPAEEREDDLYPKEAEVLPLDPTDEILAEETDDYLSGPERFARTAFMSDYELYEHQRNGFRMLGERLRRAKRQSKALVQLARLDLSGAAETLAEPVEPYTPKPPDPEGWVKAQARTEEERREFFKQRRREIWRGKRQAFFENRRNEAKWYPVLGPFAAAVGYAAVQLAR